MQNSKRNQVRRWMSYNLLRHSFENPMLTFSPHSQPIEKQRNFVNTVTKFRPAARQLSTGKFICQNSPSYPTHPDALWPIGRWRKQEEIAEVIELGSIGRSVGCATRSNGMRPCIDPTPGLPSIDYNYWPVGRSATVTQNRNCNSSASSILPLICAAIRYEAAEI